MTKLKMVLYFLHFKFDVDPASFLCRRTQSSALIERYQEWERGAGLERPYQDYTEVEEVLCFPPISLHNNGILKDVALYVLFLLLIANSSFLLLKTTLSACLYGTQIKLSRKL